MENNKDNNWSQQPIRSDTDVREGKSSLDNKNQDNEKREHGKWNDAVKQGNGDYGAEDGRSDEGVTGGETDISRPFSGGTRPEDQSSRNDEWNAQHPGELPV